MPKIVLSGPAEGRETTYIISVRRRQLPLARSLNFLLLLLCFLCKGSTRTSPFVPTGECHNPQIFATDVSSPGIVSHAAPSTSPSSSKQAAPQAQSRTDHDDKYFEISRSSCVWDNVRLKNHISLLRKKENECFERFGNDSITESLCKHLHYWKHIETYDSILSVIENGYSIPFSSFPLSMNLRNNMSALNNRQFVSKFEGSIPEMRIWSILLIKSDLK